MGTCFMAADKIQVRRAQLEWIIGRKEGGRGMRDEGGKMREGEGERGR